jgi:hypothetical protein
MVSTLLPNEDFLTGMYSGSTIGLAPSKNQNTISRANVHGTFFEMFASDVPYA